MARVVITRTIPEEGLRALRDHHDVVVADPPEGGLHDEAALVRLAADADAMITMLSDPITPEVIEALPSPAIIAQFSVGYDNIDIEAAKAANVVVTNTPDVLTDASADLTMALLLAVARRIPSADAYVRAGNFKRWETMAFLGTELRGKVLGLFGMGRIGAAVARRALGFGMEVIYHNRSRANPTVEREAVARYVSFERLLAESDILSIHASLNEDSRGIFDSDAFNRMKRGSILINTARGSVVNEHDLVEALKSGQIERAGLDVFENEPSVHPELINMDNVVLAPHIGSATISARERMSYMCAESVLAFLRSDATIPHRVV